MKFFLGTTFYSSLLLRKAPGTSTSIIIWLLFFFLPDIPFLYKIIMLAIILAFHFYSFPHFEEKYKNDDPSIYTLDETIAIIILSILVTNRISWIAVFFLFRFFDIVKPLGIRKFERLKSIPSTLRNIGDDLIAAFFTLFLIKGYEFFT
jgi:phosphatidylglycerophosphatase A